MLTSDFGLYLYYLVSLQSELSGDAPSSDMCTRREQETAAAKTDPNEAIQSFLEV